MNRVRMGSYSSKQGWHEKVLSNDSITMSRKERDSSRKKIKRKRLNKKRVALFSFFVGLVFCGFFFYNYANRIPGVNIPVVQPARSLCNNILDPQCWTDNFRPQLKQTKGQTNLLIVGLDTRKNDQGLLNTDTIALISYDHASEESMLISIPRDFYSIKYATRINAIYAFTKDRDEADPFKYLKEEVTAITGREIHYFTTVKLSLIHISDTCC